MKKKEMYRRECILKAVLVVFCFVISSCSLFARESIPYLVNAEMVTESENCEFQAAGLDLYFFNRSEKAVLSFTLVFFLFDEDGEAISDGRSNIVLSVKSRVEAGDVLESCVSLDQFFYSIPEYAYDIDYLYVSRIEYEDGEIWQDPLGMLAL